MARYSTKTEKKPEQVIEKAKHHFGEDGLNLEFVEESECCVYFKGGGGHVSVTAVADEGETTVDIETREWDNDVRKFLAEVS